MNFLIGINSLSDTCIEYDCQLMKNDLLLSQKLLTSRPTLSQKLLTSRDNVKSKATDK